MRFLIFLLFFPIVMMSQSLTMEIQQYFDLKDFIKAEIRLTDHLKEKPNDIKAIELLGDSYGHQKKWDDAIKSYEELVDSLPNNANYHYKYGGALGMKALSISKFEAVSIIGDVKEAFLKAAELDSNHIDVRWALVELYMQIPGILGGSKKKSLKYANELETLSKVDGYLAKGYIYEYDDEHELAERYYKMAITEGGSLTCYNKLTAFYEHQNKPNEAIKNIEASQKEHHRNAFHYQIGKIAAEYNLELEKGEQCLKIYIENHSVKDGVPIEWAYYRLAQIQKHKENKVEALRWIDKALDIRSDFKQAKVERQKILSL
ncbi:MAG: hypothetical protein P8X62_11980 [Flavobacteriaceae bacterium]